MQKTKGRLVLRLPFAAVREPMQDPRFGCGEGAHLRLALVQVEHGLAGLRRQHEGEVLQFGDAGGQLFQQGLGVVVEGDEAGMRVQPEQAGDRDRGGLLGGLHQGCGTAEERGDVRGDRGQGPVRVVAERRKDKAELQAGDVQPGLQPGVGLQVVGEPGEALRRVMSRAASRMANQGTALPWL